MRKPCFLLPAVFAGLGLISPIEAQTDNFLKDFVDKTAASSAPAPSFGQPVMDELFRMESTIKTASKEVIAEALPAVTELLAKGSDGQRTVAIILLFDVARREASAVLLKPYLPQILACLRDRAAGVAGFTEYILHWLFPQPVELVVPYLINYINDEQVDEQARSGGIGTLVWYAPKDPKVVSAIATFMAAGHGRTARAEAIKGLGLDLADSHQYSPELVNIIITVLNRDTDIRFESIEALGRCGWKAFAIANPILVAIAGDERESGEIREAAKAAINQIIHSPQDQR